MTRKVKMLVVNDDDMALDKPPWSTFCKPYIDRLSDNPFYDYLTSIDDGLKEFNAILKGKYVIFNSIEDMVRFKITWG